MAKKSVHPETPSQLTAEGELFERARKRLGIETQNEAAKLVGMSGTRWRQIIEADAARMVKDRGVSTLARIARRMAITPAELHAIGRDDVAARLAEISPTLTERMDRLEELLGQVRREVGSERTRELEAAFEIIRSIGENAK